jgi:hypothetical protein
MLMRIMRSGWIVSRRNKMYVTFATDRNTGEILFLGQWPDKTAALDDIDVLEKFDVLRHYYYDAVLSDTAPMATDERISVDLARWLALVRKIKRA